jgi:hypothetical protein
VSSDTRVDLFLEWQEALNSPEVDAALVASLESQAKDMGIDLWQINTLMLNSMTAAFWNPLLHPRGWGGRFIEVGDLVGFSRGGREERGTVRAIKPDGKLVVEMDQREDGINTRALTLNPQDVRPLGVKGLLRGRESRDDLPEVLDLVERIETGREALPDREKFLDRLARYYGEVPIPDWLMRWYESFIRTAQPKHMRGPRLYPRRADGMAAAINIQWNPDLHPRGRDGKFIESFGLVRLFDFTDRKGNRWPESSGKVTDITPDPDNPGNPDIEVELPEGGHVTVKPNQVASAPDVKARLGDRELGGEPSGRPEVNYIGVPDFEPEAESVEEQLEEDITFADTVYNTSRDIGMLNPGDEIILPGDMPGTIVDFEFPGDRPDSVVVHTDGGTYHGKTTDVLPNYRPGEEVNPVGEPVMAKPGELGSKTNPIKTSDPLEAVKALRDGKFVELESVDQVSTLLNELADIAAEAKAKGEEAPNYDLCNVSVPGTNLFCAESKGIPRIEMPQLSGFPVPGSRADSLERTEEGGVDIGPAFMDHLRGKGVGVTEERRLASHLKASQSELIGSKIAGMMRAMDSGNEFAIRNIRENPIFVTSDGYVIDGHHRWASVIGWDALEGGLEDYDMPVRVIDMDIMEVLSEANKFANEFGIPQVSAADVGPEIKQTNPKRPKK